MQRALIWLARHPVAILLAVLALSLASVVAVFRIPSFHPRLSIDSSVQALLPPRDANRAIYDRLRLLFGQDDPVLVAVTLTPQVMTDENLAKLDRLTQAIQQLPGIASALSVAVASNILVHGDELDVASFASQALADPGHVERLRAALQANPLYAGTLVSTDGRTAMLVVSLRHAAGGDPLDPQFAEHLRQLAAQAFPQAPVWITGSDTVRQEMSRALTRTLSRTVPAVFGLVLLLLLAAFSSIRAALAALLTVAIALLWTLAIARLMGLQLNLVTAIVPPLVVVIGLSYTIHLLSAFFLGHQLAPEPQGPAMRQWVMERIGIALTLSATTTIAGFLSLLTNPLHAVRQFAVLASIGTFLAGLLTLVFLPTLLLTIRGSHATAVQLDRVFQRVAERLATFDLKHRTAIIVVALILIPVNGWFALHIRAGAEFIRSFDAAAPVRQNFEAINRLFNGANVVPILIEAPLDDALVQPEVAQAVDGLEQWLRRQPEVGAVGSYTDVIKLANRSVHEDDPRFAILPDTPAAMSQLLTLLSGDAERNLVDARLRTAVMTVRIHADDAIAVDAFLQRLQSQIDRMPDSIHVEPTGSTVLATRAVGAVASGHLLSVIIATVVIFLLLTVLFTSARAALIATIPNLIPVAVYFGTLGLLHIPLNPTTSLIASIVLGIAVNDTVHFLARFNDDARHQGKEAGAVKSALSAVLRPITLATIALCSGLLLLTTSELHGQAQFGALAAFTLAVAWLADMTLTPALGSRLRIVTLWDLVRLDLGPSPQHTIPLLSGLSLRQARLFALTARLENHPAGTLIIREGAFARDIFVVIDGTVEVWVDREGERKVLSTMTRGSVLGEAGLFGQRRTANVDTVTPVRVLRFDSQDLERLRIRYPRVAATVLRNLNRVQAERIARMTAMLR